MRQIILVSLLLLIVTWNGAGQAPDVSAPTGRPISWGKLIPNVASDQKRVWLFPWSVAHGKAWKPALAVTATVAVLVALDPADTPHFRRTSSFGRFNSIFSSNNTTLATAIVPASFYVAGLAARNSYARGTALLAGEAVADAEILTAVMKAVDRRLRPSAVPVNGDFSDTWFRGQSRSGSFPSGHTIAAFSVATVFSRRYHEHRWAPYVAYGLAGLIGFSRVSLSAHFPSDVFMGAALGYSISRFAVLR